MNVVVVDVVVRSQMLFLVTGWAVALTYYISHSTKHRKIADFDFSGSQNP